MRYIAVAAMSENRVIGNGNEIPWHISDEFKWFKKITMGKTLLMGRKTFQSIGEPLPGRRTVVISRGGFSYEGVNVISDLSELSKLAGVEEIIVAGGGEIYRQTMDLWSEVYLSVVKRVVEGDAFFPEFEDQMEFIETVMENEDFKVLHYRR
jgi:dihydrofolate reductase